MSVAIKSMGTTKNPASANAPSVRPDSERRSPSKDIKIHSESATSERDLVENGTLEELGYVPIYRRVFNSLGNMCMVISLTSPLLAILITGFYQVTYGGYWGLSWGWIIPSTVIFPQVLAIAELASSMPVNGSFYWWSGALAPSKYSNFVSFVSGWLNVLSMFSATAAFAYAVASSVAFSVNIVAPDFVWTNPQLMGLSISVILVWAALMSLRLESISVVFMAMAGIVLLDTLIFIFALPITHRLQDLPFASAHDVFGTFENFTDWGAGAAVPFTWFAAMWVNSAWMCPVYVAEDTHNASVEIPKSIVMTYVVTAVCGLLVSLLCAFCITDMPTFGLDETGYPLVTLIVDHWGPTLSSVFFFVMVPVGFLGGSGTLVTYASQLAAFSRDGGLPFKNKFSYVNQRLNQPIYAIALLVVGTTLVLLFALSEEASSIIYSLSVVTGLFTFSLPVTLRIFAGDKWVPGPLSLGRWSVPNAIFTVISQSYLIVMECFPSYPDFTPATMNWNSLLTTGSLIFSICLYFVIGKNYKGVDQEALAHWRAVHSRR